MTIQEVISEVTEELEKIVSTQTVVGEPITAGGKTFIPITRLCVGFVSGGFESGSKNSENAPYGGGGGAGAKVEPIAFIVIDDDKTELLTIKASQLEDEIARFLSMIPSIIDKVKASSKEKKSKPKTIIIDDDSGTA